MFAETREMNLGSLGRKLDCLTLHIICIMCFAGASKQRKKATIHQVTNMLSTSKNVLFPGHNHLLTISADDLTL